ncbi:MAG: hypothetical protein JRI55_36970 [Deltaproteobacteria bacterium]|nr:hypothetical protein [Deltaproteobacteria bacterium]
MRRRIAERKWQWCTTPVDGIAVNEFPLAELSTDTIRERWGPGEYRVMFVSIPEEGVRRVNGNGRIFHLTPLGDAQAPEVPPTMDQDTLAFLRRHARMNAELADDCERIALLDPNAEEVADTAPLARQAAEFPMHPTLEPRLDAQLELARRASLARVIRDQAERIQRLEQDVAALQEAMPGIAELAKALTLIAAQLGAASQAQRV